MQTKQIITITLLILYVAGVTLIGILNRKNKSSEDYFLASRKLPPWLLSVTFIASWWGGGSAIDLVDHANRNGLSSFWIYGVAVLVATGLMFFFAKAIRKVGTVSQPQLLQMRYNQTAALLLTVFIIIFMVISAAVQVIVVGNFFHSFFNMTYEQGAFLGTAAVVLYSLFGGFRGVVLTDLLQFVFFLFAGIFLFVVSYGQSGGMEHVLQTATANGKSGYNNFFHGVGDNLGYVITFGSSWMIQANIWQRISAARNPQDAKRMVGMSFFAFIPLYLMVTYTGMFSSVVYTEIPEGGIVPDMVKNIASPVVSSIIFLGLCSAIMSTMDSLINTGALSLTVDIYRPYIKPSVSEKQIVTVGKISTLLVGLLAIFIGIKIRSVLVVSWIGADFLFTGAFVPLVLGFIWKRATPQAAVASMLFGLFFSSYNFLVALDVPLPVAWKIASVKQALLGISISLLLFIAVSLFTDDEKNRGEHFVEEFGILK